MYSIELFKRKKREASSSKSCCYSNWILRFTWNVAKNMGSGIKKIAKLFYIWQLGKWNTSATTTTEQTILPFLIPLIFSFSFSHLHFISHFSIPYDLRHVVFLCQQNMKVWTLNIIIISREWYKAWQKCWSHENR